MAFTLARNPQPTIRQRSRRLREPSFPAPLDLISDPQIPLARRNLQSPISTHLRTCPPVSFGPHGKICLGLWKRVAVSSLSKPEGLDPDSLLEADPRWQLVQRIVSSQHLVKSARLQELLLYVCRCALEDRSGDISEQTIGERVFQRPAGYNANEDNIVRAQARLLRQKLQAYFEALGNRQEKAFAATLGRSPRSSRVACLTVKPPGQIPAAADRSTVLVHQSGRHAATPGPQRSGLVRSRFLRSQRLAIGLSSHSLTARRPQPKKRTDEQTATPSTAAGQ